MEFSLQQQVSVVQTNVVTRDDRINGGSNSDSVIFNMKRVNCTIRRKKSIGIKYMACFTNQRGVLG